MKKYTVNEIFYSLQGEGINAGVPSIFVRFTGCNMRCDVEASDKSPGGFFCDTEFVSGRKMTGKEIVDFSLKISSFASCNPKFVILTGGEPALQVDEELVRLFHEKQLSVAIETNGSINLKSRGLWELDWVTVSPKVAEHAIKQKQADEVKYVRGYGQAIPNTCVKASHYLISPAFDGQNISKETLEWCIGLVKENPQWRLSCQQHKIFSIR